MRLILIMVLLGAWTGLFACQCHERSLREAVEISTKESQIIFVGDVLTSDEKKGIFKMKLVELFKGESKTKTIEGKLINSCSGLPVKGRWIIYAVTSENGVIDLDLCGPSRSFENPHHISLWATDYELPAPPTVEYKTNAEYSIQANIDYEKEMTSLKKQALIDLESEIKELRKMLLRPKP
jgi:hypothetical protein